MSESVSINPTVGRLEKFIAKAYIFLLTLRMIGSLTFMQSFVHAAAADTDFILHILGVLLILYRNHGKIFLPDDNETHLLKFFGGVVLFLNVSSLIMACCMQWIYGSIGSDTAFSAVSGQIVYWFQYVFIFYYNKEIFSFLTKEEIESVIQAEIWALLVLGYIQIGAMFFGTIAQIYDKFDVFSVLVNSNIMSKLSLTGTEGASGGSIIGIFVIPFLLSGFLNKNDKHGEILQIILWLPILYFTNSSAAYLTALSCLPILFIIIGKRGLLSKQKFIRLMIVCLVVVVAFMAKDKILNILPQNISNQLRYLILEKATDQDNGSTVSRTIPIIENWGAFKEFPILGVGNGCQGYFYIKYFPNWARNVAGSDVMKFYHRAEQGIVNGAVFFPSILSGYGIVGTVLIVVYIVRSHNLLQDKVALIPRWVDFYFLAAIPILVRGISTEYAGEYYIWFILSIPYMNSLQKEQLTQSKSVDMEEIIV